MAERNADVAIVGAGILGLAHALAAAKAGRSVVVFERGSSASGASIRNFGMVWPIGQPSGAMHVMAMRSREIWLDTIGNARIPVKATGSLHVVYRHDEEQVAREFAEIGPAHGYECGWLNPAQVLEHSEAVIADDLRGGIWSPTECTVDPRLTIRTLPAFLTERYGIQFHFNHVVREIDLPIVQAGSETWQVETAIVCSGHDFETLYPAAFANSGITRCKLQMMRTLPQPDNWQLGPSLAAGLTLRFYPSFNICTTLPALRKRIAEETPELDQYGIHILVSQTAAGEITLGDSHEYGADVSIFDKTEIDDLILEHAGQFLDLPEWSVAEHWHGIYAKHPDEPYVAIEPAEGVRIVTATGGSGMTLSFGLADQMVREMGL